MKSFGWWVLLVALGIVLCSGQESGPPLVPEDREALRELQTVWGAALDWVGEPSCFFPGVTCSAVNSSASVVVGLYARSASLCTGLPLALFSLKSLATLDLVHNWLQGSVPAEISSLSRLAFLSLSQNQLSGPLPPLPPSLSMLDLSSNAFSALPSPLSLPSVFFLNLSSNAISAPLPLLLSSLPSLQYLDISENEFDGPITNFATTSLQTITALLLSSNRLSGSFPSAAWQMPLLQSLFLSHNQLSGTLPPALHEALAQLDVAWNNLSGVMPEWVCGMTVFNGQHNNFSCPLPSCCVTATLQTNCSPCIGSNPAGGWGPAFIVVVLAILCITVLAVLLFHYRGKFTVCTCLRPNAPEVIGQSDEDNSNENDLLGQLEEGHGDDDQQLLHRHQIDDDSDDAELRSIEM